MIYKRQRPLFAYSIYLTIFNIITTNTTEPGFVTLIIFKKLHVVEDGQV